MNIILLVTDDQDMASLNADAMPYLHSQPHGNWVIFPNAHQSTPLCGPCRANLLGGQRTDRNSVTNNATGSFDAAHAVSVALQTAGVTTGMFGKWLNAYTANTVPAGWDDAWIFQKQAGESFYDWELATTPTGVEAPGDYPGEYVTDILADKVTGFITANAAGPFFAMVGFNAPHTPSTPATRHASTAFTISDPPDWNTLPTDAPTWLAGIAAMTSGQQTTTRNLRKEMWRTLLAVDEAIEAIFDTLVAEDILDETVVIFCTDNAYANGRKRLGDNQKDNSKQSPYRYSSSGLLRIRYPGVTGRTDDSLIDFLDIPAMICANFGATPQETLDGADFTEVITESAPWRDAVFSTYIGAGASPVSDVPNWRAIRTARWRYADYYEEDEVELYDLDADPNETANVAAANPSVVAEMADLVDQHLDDPHWWESPTIPGLILLNGVLTKL